MQPQEVLGNPLLIAAVGATTVTYAIAVAWIASTIYRAPPDLLQVQLFRKLRDLQNSILLMGIGLVVGLTLTTLFIANLGLPDYAWVAGAAVAAVLFWYGLFRYSSVFRVPRDAPK